jgi:hypothetical protein
MLCIEGFWEIMTDRNLPECGLGLASNTARRTLNTTLLSEWCWRSTILLLHVLLLWWGHALWGTLHTIPIALLRELGLLVGVVLVSHLF